MPLPTPKFQFELVGHIFAFQLEAALGVVAGDVSVEHRAQHSVISQTDTHPLPDFEGRGVHRRVTGTFLDDHAVLHDLGGYPAGILAFEGGRADDGRTENGPPWGNGWSPYR